MSENAMDMISSKPYLQANRYKYMPNLYANNQTNNVLLICTLPLCR